VVVAFLLDDPDLVIVRPTDDVDAIAAVVNRREYSSLEEKLREEDFRHDTTEHAPACRFIYNGIKVDVMPARDETGRFSDQWFAYALETASAKTLRGLTVNTVSAPSLIATKITAFEDRGHGDYASHDIEDIIAVVDGRRTLVDEVAGEESTLQHYISRSIRDMMRNQRFRDVLPGHLSGDDASQRRLPLVIERLNALASL
jgi:predicted nucleotidyltransferase